MWETTRQILYYSTALYYRTSKRHRLHDVGFYEAQDVVYEAQDVVYEAQDVVYEAQDIEYEAQDVVYEAQDLGVRNLC